MTAALEYYGSDKARVDFLNNREAPVDIIGKHSAKGDSASGLRTTSVVDHLFEGQFKKGAGNKKHKIGQVSRIISEAPEISQMESQNS